MPVNWPEKWTVKRLKHCSSCGSAPPQLGSCLMKGRAAAAVGGGGGAGSVGPPRTRKPRRPGGAKSSTGAHCARAAHGQGRIAAAAAQRGTAGSSAFRSRPEPICWDSSPGRSAGLRLCRRSALDSTSLLGPDAFRTPDPRQLGPLKNTQARAGRVRRRRLRGHTWARLLPREEVRIAARRRRGPAPGLPSGLWVGR